MLKFAVYNQNDQSPDFILSNSYLLGADDIGIRANITYEDHVITCDKKTMGPAAFALQIPVNGLGELTLQTCLLAEREKPYILMLELARQRIMKIIAKMEDWSIYELDPTTSTAKRLKLAKDKFIQALISQNDPPESDRLARESLAAAIDASEEFTILQADRMLRTRKEQNHLPKHIFGVGVGLKQTGNPKLAQLLSNFDYLRLPTPWRVMEPEEQNFSWEPLDAWAEWAFRNKMKLVAGPIVSFNSTVVPDWLYIWEHDYDTIRDLLYEHIERVVTRYKNVVSLWNVVSGIHTNNQFQFNFEQLMDLTRMAIMLTKQVQPNSKTLIEIVEPFGEYHANNSRSIPPMMYAEMVLQSGIPFDGFGLKLMMGQSTNGQYTRDLLQLSTMLDRFSQFGKPVYVTAVGVPSQTIEEPFIEPHVEEVEVNHTAGYWRKPWNEIVQSRWLEVFYNIAMSKPYVESVAWLTLADHAGVEMPFCGLADNQANPKKAYKKLMGFRKHLHEPQPA